MCVYMCVMWVCAACTVIFNLVAGEGKSVDRKAVETFIANCNDSIADCQEQIDDLFGKVRASVKVTHTRTHARTHARTCTHTPTWLCHAPSVSIQDDEVTEEDFIEWLLTCPTFTSLTQWLLGEESNQLKLTDTDSTPSYHQTIARLTRGRY